MATPVFGFSNKRDGTVVVMDDGSVWTRFVNTNGAYAWQEQTPLPKTPRGLERLKEATRAD